MATSGPSAGKDVAKPGSTPASATSKPVIVGHTAEVADPMVSSRRKEFLQIEPAKDKDSEQDSQETSSEPAKKESAKTPKDEAEKTTEPTVGSSKPKLVPSASAQQLQAETEKEQDEAALTAEQEAEAKATDESQTRLQEIIESGEYNVSIGQGSTGNSIKTFLITVISIVLVGVVVLFILTDLKVIDLGIKLPFHIFKQ